MSRNEVFLPVLSKYINGGCLTPADRWISSYSKVFSFYKNAGRVCKNFRNSKSSAGSIGKEIVITPYTGSNRYALGMKEYLAANLAGELFDVLVHGSLGTGEEIAYTDFDALVILKDQVFDSPGRLRNVAMKLSRARRFMYEFDPLQHHGWFVLVGSSFLTSDGVRMF